MVQVERLGVRYGGLLASRLDRAVNTDAPRRAFARFSRAGYLAR